MKLDNFIALVRTTLEDNTNNTFTDASFIAWLEMGINDFFERTRIYYDRTRMITSAGIAAYQLDGATLLTPHVRMSDIAASSYSDLTRSDFTYPSNVDSGKPTSYALTADSIVLFPTPDAQYEVVVDRCSIPACPIEGSDEVPMSRYVAAYRDFVLCEAFLQLEQFDVASNYSQMYAVEVNKALDTDLIAAQENMTTSRPTEVY